MPIELGIFICTVFFAALYFTIKTAVSKGIDQSKEVKLLRREIAALKKIKTEEQEKHIINTKA